MASESLSRGVDLFFAQEFCFFKPEHGPPRGSKQAKTDVLLTMVLGSLRWGSQPHPAARTAAAARRRRRRRGGAEGGTGQGLTPLAGAAPVWRRAAALGTSVLSRLWQDARGLPAGLRLVVRRRPHVAF